MSLLLGHVETLATATQTALQLLGDDAAALCRHARSLLVAALCTVAPLDSCRCAATIRLAAMQVHGTVRELTTAQAFELPL